MAQKKPEKTDKYTTYKNAQKDRGKMKIHPWIYTVDEDKVKNYIAKCNKKHEAKK